jgi:hypothetical protein
MASMPFQERRPILARRRGTQTPSVGVALQNGAIDSKIGRTTPLAGSLDASQITKALRKRKPEVRLKRKNFLILK